MPTSMTDLTWTYVAPGAFNGIYSQQTAASAPRFTGTEPLTKIAELLDAFLQSSATPLRRYDAYYEGEQPLAFMVPALQREFGDRITQLVLNWPRLGADAYENRLDIEGFRFKGDDSADEKLAEVWQANDCDEQSQKAHLDSLVMSRAYVIVGAGDSDDDPPVVTVESPLQVAALRDPRTRKVSQAIKRWAEFDGSEWATLYLPDSTTTLVKDHNDWRVVNIDRHGLGHVPVVPLVNRPRILRPDGISEFHDVLPVADAANKIATDMMVSAEFHAMPRRWAFGLKQEDFVDDDGNPLSTWATIAGRLWSTEQGPDDVAVGQFPEADLSNFHNTVKLLAQVASQILALPPHYMGFTGDNPASADAIRSSETQLVKRVERKHTFLGGAWEDVQRLVLRIMDGDWDDKAKSLETLWRDPSTPTVAQKADAEVKLFQAGIVPKDQARENLGYTAEQRRRMKDMDKEEATDPVIEGILRQVRGAPATAKKAAAAPSTGASTGSDARLRS